MPKLLVYLLCVFCLLPFSIAHASSLNKADLAGCGKELSTMKQAYVDYIDRSGKSCLDSDCVQSTQKNVNSIRSLSDVDFFWQLYEEGSLPGIEDVLAQCIANSKTTISGTSNISSTSTNASGTLDQAQIDACSNDIKAMQVQSQSWPGDVNDTAARLGQYQKDMFEGRCAGHPEAQAYIASANRMLGNGSGAGATKNGKRSNVSDANATHCLAPQKEGGVINNCDYAVEYNYCVVQPTPGSWAASFDCNQGKSGSWQVGPNSRAIMQTAGSQVAFFGCKYGPTLSNPDGISPADFRYNASGMPSGRCREWGAP